MSFADKILSKFGLSDSTAIVAKNIGWALLGKLVTLLGSFVVGIFVARYLGPEQYGLMSYVISYVAIFQVIATFGLDNIEIREEAKNKDERDAIIGTAFVLKLIFAILTIALIFMVITVSKTDYFTKWMIMLYSLTIICSCFFVARNYFTAIVWNEYVVKTEISRTIIGIAVKVVLLIRHARLEWFIGACVFDYILLATGYCLSYSKKIDKVRLWRFDRKWAGFLIRQSFPQMLSLTAVVDMQRIDHIMISEMIDNESVGHYSVAFKFVEVMIFIPTIMAQTIAPMLVKLRSRDESKYKDKAQVFMDVTVWICILMAVAVCVVSGFLVKITFGVQYLFAIPVLQIMSFKVVFDALSQTSGQMIIVEGIHKLMVVREMLGLVCCVVMNYVLIPRYGIVGSAIASVGTIAVSGFLSQALLPGYWHVFKYEVRALFLGWRSILKIKSLIKE